MTDKLFHTTNDETLLSGIHFDKSFQPMRDRGKSKWKIDKKAKEHLKNSISVVNQGNFACTNSLGAEILDKTD